MNDMTKSCDKCSSFDFSCTGACRKPFGIKLKLKAIKVPVWVSIEPGVSVRRDALDHDHPESIHNWVKDNIGVNLEEWMLS